MPDLNLPTGARLDRRIKNLENKLRNDPADVKAANNLVNILEYHIPSAQTSDRYTECQRELSSSIGNDFEFSDLLIDDQCSIRFKQWWEFLRVRGLKYFFPITQLVVGNLHRIHGEHTYCSHRLQFFNDQGVISRICHDCFKVQILPSDLVGMFKLYFVLRDLKLPRDNRRKCMIEVREDVVYPYKGYIFCQSEEEVEFCRYMLKAALDKHRISDQYCGISHGCSEYGLKYPAFKYSPDGAHNTFERPNAWDKAEDDFIATTTFRLPPWPDRNTTGITIRDLIAFRTWVDYAEMIGDKSCRQFRNMPVGKFPEPYATRVRRQAKQRKEQLEELRSRLA